MKLKKSKIVSFSMPESLYQKFWDVIPANKKSSFFVWALSRLDEKDLCKFLELCFKQQKDRGAI